MHLQDSINVVISQFNFIIYGKNDKIEDENDQIELDSYLSIHNRLQ